MHNAEPQVLKHGKGTGKDESMVKIPFVTFAVALTGSATAFLTFDFGATLSNWIILSVSLFVALCLAIPANADRRVVRVVTFVFLLLFAVPLYEIEDASLWFGGYDYLEMAPTGMLLFIVGAGIDIVRFGIMNRLSHPVVEMNDLFFEQNAPSPSTRSVSNPNLHYWEDLSDPRNPGYDSVHRRR